MPKENRKRGQRGSKKRKYEEDGGDIQLKRHKSQQDEADDVDIIVNSQVEEPYQDEADFVFLGNTGPADVPFYGLLDEQEQEYFKQADSILELNQFTEPNDKALFVDSVYKEAQGKELKIANSQSCSRLLERLLAVSSSEQMKQLWIKFQGHFLHLFQHRFASHCCEALFRSSAPFVRQEMLVIEDENTKQSQNEGSEISYESLYLGCVQELEDNLGYLVTDRFASHPLRVLLAILSGMAPKTMDAGTLFQSKKKEHNYFDSVRAYGQGDDAVAVGSKASPVPASFNRAAQQLISKTVAPLDTTAMRVLATHPVANPVLQLFLHVSLTGESGKSLTVNNPDSLFRKLFPDEVPAEGTESASFINYLIYDAIGSRLIETLVDYAPGKIFKTLFKTLFAPRLASFARNDIASFIVARILARIGKDDLESAMESLCNQMRTLMKRQKFAVIRILIERCRMRGLDETPIAQALNKIHDKKYSNFLTRILDRSSNDADGDDDKGVTETSSEKAKSKSKPLPDKAHNDSAPTSQTQVSLLVQIMLSELGPLRDLITTSLLTLPPAILKTMSESRPTSQIIQTALLQPPTQPPNFRRQIIPLFCLPASSARKEAETNTDSIAIAIDMATHPIASHVLDAIWEATEQYSSSSNAGIGAGGRGGGLTFLRERVANALISAEPRVKDSMPGRLIWRKWKLDIYKRDGRWEPSTTTTTPYASTSKLPNASPNATRKPIANPTTNGATNKILNTSKDSTATVNENKTAIQLARERFANQQEQKSKREKRQQRQRQQQQHGSSPHHREDEAARHVVNSTA